jgi:hypothetical protein
MTTSATHMVKTTVSFMSPTPLMLEEDVILDFSKIKGQTMTPMKIPQLMFTVELQAVKFFSMLMSAP